MKTLGNHRSQVSSQRRILLRVGAGLAFSCCFAPVKAAQAEASVEDEGPLSSIFSKLWRTHGWRGSVSRSGPGSSLEATQAIREQLTQLIRTYNVQSVVDLACGDFHWMQHVDFAGATYTGVDIVAPMVESLQREFQTPDGKRTFLCGDATKDPIPKADLVIARDVVGHLSFENGQALIDNVRASGASYFLSTYFTGGRTNCQIEDGSWRPVDLSQAPYNLGPPLAVIHENCPEGNGEYADKELGLWRLSP